MQKTATPDFLSVDNKLIDGLVFCGEVYALFDQVMAAPGGLEQIRLRSTKLSKRLIEELIPIARYIQARYEEGRRIKVRWLSGSQSYDAILWSSGDGVKHGAFPKRLNVEVTTAEHECSYLARQQLHTQGMTWGSKNIRRNKSTRHIVSDPYVYSGDERGRDLADHVIERLEAKSAKHYPPSTVLIVRCFADALILHDDWNQAVALVEQSKQHLAFREVFLYESTGSYSATLYGSKKRRSTRPKRR